MGKPSKSKTVLTDLLHFLTVVDFAPIWASLTTKRESQVGFSKMSKYSDYKIIKFGNTIDRQIRVKKIGFVSLLLDKI